MVLYAMLGLCFYIVEQLIVFMLNIFNDLFSVVEFDIMRIVGLVVFFVKIMMIEASMITFPVSVVAIAMMSSDWLMDSVVSVEMRIMLNAVDIMVNIMSWVERVGMRVVVVSTMAMISNIVVSVMEVIDVTFVMWSFMVDIMVWSIMVEVMNWVLIVHLVVEFDLVVWSIMVDFVMWRFVVLFMVNKVSWMISLVVNLMGSHFVWDIVDLVWKLVIVVMVMVMLMVNHTTLNHFMAVFVSVVILVMDVVEFWLMMVIVFVWNVMEVRSMFGFMIVVMVSMVVIVIILVVWLVMRFMSFFMFLMMGFMVVIEVSMMILDVASITSEFAMMFIVVNMSIMVITGFMTMNVSWAIFVMMSTCAMVVQVCIPASVRFVLISVNWSIVVSFMMRCFVVRCFVVRCLVVWCFVVSILIDWSEVVISMSFEMVNNWAFMVRSIMLRFFHQVLHCMYTMGPSFTMACITL